jgi:hypothetical protein
MKVRGLEMGKSEDEGLAVNLDAVVAGRLQERAGTLS